MSSSTLPSEKPAGARYFALLAVAACATLVFGAWYSVAVNPEIRFYDEFLKVKVAYAKRLDARYRSKVVVAGGSSTAFAIQAERMLRQHNVPTVNMGLQAGLGPELIASFGVEVVRPGDTLVLAIEPELLTRDNQHVFGPQFCAATGRWEAVNRFRSEPISRRSLPTFLRPGGYHYVVLLAKLLTGRPMFRFSAADVSGDGWQTTSVRGDLSGARPDPNDAMRLTARASHLFEAVRAYCKARNVAVYYSMPWKYVPPTYAAQERERVALFLSDIAQVIPVLPDPEFGVDSNVSHFADVVFHVNQQGAVLRTDAFAASLAAGQKASADHLARVARGTEQ